VVQFADVEAEWFDLYATRTPVERAYAMLDSGGRIAMAARNEVRTRDVAWRRLKSRGYGLPAMTPDGQRRARAARAARAAGLPA
jgi:hypothetical protein